MNSSRNMSSNMHGGESAAVVQHVPPPLEPGTQDNIGEPPMSPPNNMRPVGDEDTLANVNSAEDSGVPAAVTPPDLGVPVAQCAESDQQVLEMARFDVRWRSTV